MHSGGHKTNDNQATYHINGVTTPCSLTFFGQRIYIYLADEKKSLLIWDLKNSTLSWQGGTLVIQKGSEKLECTGSIAQQISRADLRELAPVKKRMKVRGVHVFFATLGLAIVATALAIYFYLVPWLAEKTTTFVPLELEIRLGEQLSDVLSQGKATNDSVDHYARRFMAGLELDTHYPVKLNVLQSPEINAFALPGGRIYIYSGLLEKMDGYEELVALIGHELTHVTHQHSLKSIFRGAAAGMVLGGVFGDMGGAGSWILSKADEFKQLDYSRELETEADNEGLKMMTDNRVDPHGMIRLLELLQNEGEQTPAMMKYLSTHPETEARILNIAGNPALKNEFPVNQYLQRCFNDLQRSLTALNNTN